MTRNEAKQAAREGLTILAVNAALWYTSTLNGVVSGTANATLGNLIPTTSLLGLLCQPWSVLVMGLAWSTLPAPYAAPATFATTSLLTLLIYRRLNRAGRLIGIKRVLSGRQARVAGIVTAFVFVLVLVSEYKDFPVRQQGQDAFGNDWSRSYTHVGTSQTRVYQPAQRSLQHGDYLRPTLWQDQIAPDKIDALMEAMMMERIATPRTLPENFAHQAPYWWHPRLTSDTRAYQWTAGGHHQDYRTYAIYDPATQTIHVRED